MLKYTIKRILLLIPTLIIVLTIVFILMQLVPGSPVALLVDDSYTREEIYQLEVEMGFHDPIWEQYFRYVKGIFPETGENPTSRTNRYFKIFWMFGSRQS